MEFVAALLTLIILILLALLAIERVESNRQIMALAKLIKSQNLTEFNLPEQKPITTRNWLKDKIKANEDFFYEHTDEE